LVYEQNLKAEIQTSTVNTPYIQWTDASKINDTAAGIQMLTAAGNEKFYLPLQLDEAELLEQYVKRSLENNVTFRSDPFVIRLIDKKPIRVEPSQLSVSFDVFAKGSAELQNKVQRQQGLEKAWQLSIGAAQMESMLYGRPLTDFAELKKEIMANLGISQPDKFMVDPKKMGMQSQAIPPEMEWIGLKNMASGLVPIQPLMIQAGEDYRKHYEHHLSMRATEEYASLPDQLKMVWDVHLASYAKVLNLLDSMNQDAKREKQADEAEVAVSV